MNNSSTAKPASASQEVIQRDGTSQAGRVQAALDPTYVAVDERSLKDLLAFASEYATELRFFAANGDRVEAVGDWSGFINSQFDLDEVVAFLQAPETFATDRARLYTRPHFVLFLTFLHLLRHAQDQLNTLTQRHLDFYYQQVLRMQKRPGTPDQVHVLVDLAPDTAQWLLPAGTLLNAGADSLGQDRFYRTDQELVANHAQVAQLSSLFVEKRVSDIHTVRATYAGPKEEGFFKALEMALGVPAPADPLPKFPTETAEGKTVDWPFLQQLHEFVSYVEKGFYLSFDELYQLMRLKNQRDQADEEWSKINTILEKAGKQRTDDTYRLNPANPRDFDTNLKNALGNPPDFDEIFNDITLVKDIYDAYNQRTRDEVRKRIVERFFLSLDDFTELMQIKIRIDSEWEEINRILERAGQRKRNLEPPFHLPANTDPTDFAANLEQALGPLAYPQTPGLPTVQDIDSFYAHLLTIERFFFMPLGDFSALLAVATQAEPTAQEWQRADTILANAYKTKVYARRREHLKEIREQQSFEAMLAFAAGVEGPNAELSPLATLLEFVKNADDATFLTQTSQKETSGLVLTPAEWERLYRIVETAQRLREKLPEPVAQKEEWLNLHAAPDATTVSVTAGLAADEHYPRWRTFGRAEPNAEKASPPPPVFGWAVTSPLLALSQGERTITLTLGFLAEAFNADALWALFPGLPAAAERGEGPFAFDKAGGPFRIEVSTEKGWIEADSVMVDLGNYSFLSNVADDQAKTMQALQFKLTFAAKVDALAPPPAEAGQIETPWPVLRLLIQPIWQADSGDDSAGRFITHYQALKGLVLLRTHLSVDVAGLTPLRIQNDENQLEPGKPFEPFGSRAVAGSRFYCGHPEWVYKNPSQLTFHIEWMGVPDNLKTHYLHYEAITDASNFSARISLVDRRVVLPLETEAPLFASMADANQAHTISINGFPPLVERSGEMPTDADLLNWSRYLQWELNPPDFQQDAYPLVATMKTIELAAAVAKGAGGPAIKAADYQVNPPYLAKIKQLSIDYSAAMEIDLARYRPGAQLDRLFHLQPFGHSELPRATQAQPVLFLPQFEYEGELYIGIENVQAPQNLALLFQLAEGSADPDVEPVPLQWSYLSDNRWVSLDDGSVLQDTTRGLINTGILVFDLKVARPNTLLPPALYWLRAAIPRNSSGACDTVAIHSQAVSATFVDQANAPDHLSRPLPAASIGELAEALPAVLAIRQPYTSYGGKMAEEDRTFYTRISERLRHKQRAVTGWDYEHLVLERFPQLYKAKCLPANPAQPGQVELVVIPDIRNKLPFNPFEPKAPADLIAEIESFLAANTPTFATVMVKNAYYVPVKVRFAVRFLPGRNEGFYRQLLNEEINRFLSPWAYEEGADIVIGGRIYANVIINFIEQRPYVDYVAQIKLFSSEDGRTFRLAQPSPTEGYWVETKRPDGILVAARQHEIDMIVETTYAVEDFTGINYMKIELDFIVADEQTI